MGHHLVSSYAFRTYMNQPCVTATIFWESPSFSRYFSWGLATWPWLKSSEWWFYLPTKHDFVAPNFSKLTRVVIRHYPLVMTNSSPWKDPPCLIGKASINGPSIYTMAMLNNQMVLILSILYNYQWI